MHFLGSVEKLTVAFLTSLRCQKINTCHFWG